MIQAALGECELAQREVQYINRHGEEGACGRSRRKTETMDDQKRTRVGKREDRFRMCSRLLSVAPSFFFLNLYSHLLHPSAFKCPFCLPSRSRCQISLAPFLFVLLPFFALVFFFFFSISLVFEIDAMLPNELLLPPTSHRS